MTDWREDEKERFSFWEFRYLVNRIKDDGWTLSGWVHTALILYCEIEDPIELQKQTRMKKMIPELKVLRPGNGKKMYSGSGSGVQENPEYLVLRSQKLQELGTRLMELSCWEKIRRSLVVMDPDSDYWNTAIKELNTLDGKQWDETELWNMAIDWWNQYGKAIA